MKKLLILMLLVFAGCHYDPEYHDHTPDVYEGPGARFEADVRVTDWWWEEDHHEDDWNVCGHVENFGNSYAMDAYVRVRVYDQFDYLVAEGGNWVSVICLDPTEVAHFQVYVGYVAEYSYVTFDVGWE